MNSDLIEINRAIAEYYFGSLANHHERFIAQKHTCLGRMSLDQQRIAELLDQGDKSAALDLRVVYLNRDYLRFAKLVANQGLGNAPHKLVVVGMTMRTARSIAALSESDLKKVSSRADGLVFNCQLQPFAVAEALDQRDSALLAMMTS